MKQLFLIALLACMQTSSAFAFSERFKEMFDGAKSYTYVTDVVNVSNEREPNFCTYLFSPFINGKYEGTLTFEFLLNPKNETSVNIKQQAVEILKDLKSSEYSEIVLTIELTTGERLYFDASSMKDWNQSEWRQLLRVSYDKTTGEYRTSVTFPIEYLWSSVRDLPNNNKKRHTYVLQQLQNYSISSVSVTDIYYDVHLEFSAQFARPTDGTFNDMINKAKKKK